MGFEAIVYFIWYGIGFVSWSWITWITKRHRLHDLGRWDFYAVYFAAGDRKMVRLFRASYLPIRYHVKIRSVANPYDPDFDDYFAYRDFSRKLNAMSDRILLYTDCYHRLAA